MAIFGLNISNQKLLMKETHLREKSAHCPYVLIATVVPDIFVASPGLIGLSNLNIDYFTCRYSNGAVRRSTSNDSVKVTSSRQLGLDTVKQCFSRYNLI